MSKTFFNEYEAFDKNGVELMDDVDAALKPVVDKWLASGYSCREIGGIILNAVVSLMAEITLRRAMYKRKNRGDV